MKISPERLQAEAQTSGFRPEVLEKVFQLLNLLEGFQSHPFLKGRLVLKGATALNLFLFDLPRLSVDIDMNYVGAVDRSKMIEERPKVEQAVQAVCSREGMTVIRQPTDHAGGKWRLRYDRSTGLGGNLEIDLNYLLRVPLWPVRLHDSRQVGSFAAKGIPVVDIHELAAGKLAALLARQASRDLFDAYQLFTVAELQREKLRLGFVLYGAMNRRDWRTVNVNDVGADPGELQNQLVPLMQSDLPDRFGGSDTWTKTLVETCRDKFKAVLPLAKNEKEFLNRLLEQGEIEPSLLTEDQQMCDRIKSHPGLQWKALNVREYKNRKPVK